MRTYKGSRAGDRCVVLVVEEDGKGHVLSSGPSQAIYNHSPDGFEWGYSGSGPSQLALAILLDHIGHTPVEKRITPETAPVLAERHYQLFKGDKVTAWGDTWTLTSVEIDGWLAMQKNNAETKKRDYTHSPQFPKDLMPQGGGGTIIHG
jgi:hypothetical protein